MLVTNKVWKKLYNAFYAWSITARGLSLKNKTVTKVLLTSLSIKLLQLGVGKVLNHVAACWGFCYPTTPLWRNRTRGGKNMWVTFTLSSRLAFFRNVRFKHKSVALLERVKHHLNASGDNSQECAHRGSSYLTRNHNNEISICVSPTWQRMYTIDIIYALINVASCKHWTKSCNYAERELTITGTTPLSVIDNI